MSCRVGQVYNQLMLYGTGPLPLPLRPSFTAPHSLPTASHYPSLTAPRSLPTALQSLPLPLPFNRPRCPSLTPDIRRVGWQRHEAGLVLGWLALGGCGRGWGAGTGARAAREALLVQAGGVPEPGP